MQKTNKVDAAQELLERRKARAELIEFYKYTFDEFVEGDHINRLCDALERIERGECKRLIISLPPRHSKSETASVRFVSWYLGRHPKAKIVLTSYSQSIAEEQARKAKDLFFSEKYKTLFPDIVPRITDKLFKHSDKQFETLKRGSVYAVGIGGTLTGRGFDIGIIDDYVKDRAEANSEVQKQRTNDWYASTFFTRQSPDAAIIVIATRWAQDDLIGKLLKEEPDEWETVLLPAVDEGKALWEERFNYEKLMQIKKSIGIFEWSALYLGEPTVKEGNRFKVDNIVWHDNLDEFPTNGRIMRCWDLASTVKERDRDDKPDYTVGVKGRMVNKNGIYEMWIEDVVMGRWEAPARDEIIRQTVIKDGNYVPIFVEAFAAYKDAYTSIKRALAGRYTVNQSRPPGDKETKAAGMQPIFEVSNIHILKGSYAEEVVKQFKEFPSGKHDDVVDAFAILYHEGSKSQSGLLIS